MPSLIGNKPNQVPSNGDLGTLAFQDANAVNITGGVVDVSAGTAALPTLGTTGDENTGVFFPAADTVAVSTNATERMRIDSSGNVGIGTSSPTQPLTIGGSGNILATAGATWFSGGHLYIRAGAGGNLRFGANNANDLLTLNTTGTLILNGGDISANGSGVTFPAAQNASSNANTLDDYEEGTWTPTAIGRTTAGVTTYTTQSGRYTKIGNLVTVSFNLAITNMTGTGVIAIESLPFASSSSSFTATGSCMTNNLDYPTGTAPTLYIENSRTFLEIYISGDNIAWDRPAVDTSFSIVGSISYYA